VYNIQRQIRDGKKKKKKRKMPGCKQKKNSGRDPGMKGEYRSIGNRNLRRRLEISGEDQRRRRALRKLKKETYK